MLTARPSLLAHYIWPGDQEKTAEGCWKGQSRPRKIISSAKRADRPACHQFILGSVEREKESIKCSIKTKFEWKFLWNRRRRAKFRAGLVQYIIILFTNKLPRPKLQFFRQKLSEVPVSVYRVSRIGTDLWKNSAQLWDSVVRSMHSCDMATQNHRPKVHEVR